MQLQEVIGQRAVNTSLAMYSVPAVSKGTVSFMHQYSTGTLFLEMEGSRED